MSMVQYTALRQSVTETITARQEVLRTAAQDGHLDSHTTPEIWCEANVMMMSGCLMSSDVS